MSGFLFQISEKGTDVGTPLITLDANTLDEALEGIDKYVEEHSYEYYVNNYKKGRYVIGCYEYVIKKKTVYIAFDGKEFSKMTECELYEERMKGG